MLVRVLSLSAVTHEDRKESLTSGLDEKTYDTETDIYNARHGKTERDRRKRRTTKD